MNDVGCRIQSLREELDMTQRELANKINISFSVMNRIESGKRALRNDEIVKIAKILNVSADYLLGKSDNKNPYKESKEPTLTKKDIKEIDAYIDALEHDFTAGEGVLFDGEPVDDETLRAFLDTVRIGAEIAKKRNKEKFTPKKYRDQ